MTRRGFLGAIIPAAAMGDLVPRPDTDAIARHIFDKANEIRVNLSVPPLEWSEQIAACARRQSERKKLLRFAGHDDPELGGIAERLDRGGVPWKRCAENLFELRGYEDPTNFALVFWWYSAGHQANLVDPTFRQTGVAVTLDCDDRFFVAQIFVDPIETRLRRRGTVSGKTTEFIRTP